MATTTLSPARSWLNQHEAADYLGVTDRTIRNYIARGTLPARRVTGSRLIRIDQADLDGLLRPIPTAKGQLVTAPPDSVRTPRTTARPAETRTESQRPDPALLRRTVDAIVTLATSAGMPLRRKEARAVALAWMGAGRAEDELEAWLRASYRVDPVGVTAVRNVARGGGLHGTA